MEAVIAGRRVMRKSLFAGERRVVPEANPVTDAAASHASALVTYALAGSALLVALVGLGLPYSSKSKYGCWNTRAG
jgi:hypothetical protein